MRWRFEPVHNTWDGFSREGENVVSVFGEFTQRGAARFAVRLWDKPSPNRTTHKTLTEAKAFATQQYVALLNAEEARP